MNRKIEIIIAVLILVLLVAVIGFIVWRGRTPAVVEPVASTTLPTTDALADAPVVAPTSVPKVSTVSAQTISQVFIERFGSFSSESNYANIDDILSLATPSFKTELERIARQARAKAKADDAYYGISTKILSQSVEAESDSTATIIAMTQRAESIGSPGNTTIKYQNITVDLLKSGNTWLVNGFEWAN